MGKSFDSNQVFNSKQWHDYDSLRKYLIIYQSSLEDRKNNRKKAYLDILKTMFKEIDDRHSNGVSWLLTIFAHKWAQEYGEKSFDKERRRLIHILKNYDFPRADLAYKCSSVKDIVIIMEGLEALLIHLAHGLKIDGFGCTDYEIEGLFEGKQLESIGGAFKGLASHVVGTGNTNPETAYSKHSFAKLLQRVDNAYEEYVLCKLQKERDERQKAKKAREEALVEKKRQQEEEEKQKEIGTKQKLEQLALEVAIQEKQREQNEQKQAIKQELAKKEREEKERQNKELNEKKRQIELEQQQLAKERDLLEQQKKINEQKREFDEEKQRFALLQLKEEKHRLALKEHVFLTSHQQTVEKQPHAPTTEEQIKIKKAEQEQELELKWNLLEIKKAEHELELEMQRKKKEQELALQLKEDKVKQKLKNEKQPPASITAEQPQTTHSAPPPDTHKPQTPPNLFAERENFKECLTVEFRNRYEANKIDKMKLTSFHNTLYNLIRAINIIDTVDDTDDIGNWYKKESVHVCFIFRCNIDEYIDKLKTDLADWGELDTAVDTIKKYATAGKEKLANAKIMEITPQVGDIAKAGWDMYNDDGLPAGKEHRKHEVYFVEENGIMVNNIIVVKPVVQVYT